MGEDKKGEEKKKKRRLSQSHIKRRRVRANGLEERVRWDDEQTVPK